MKFNRFVFFVFTFSALIAACGRPQVPPAPVLPILATESLVDPATPTPLFTPEIVIPTAEPALGPSIDNPAKAMLTRSLIATRAAELAALTMPGPYSWDEFRSCSTFVSAYLRQLSFPVDGLTGQYEDYPDPFPWSGTVEQVNWARRNFPQFTYDAPLKDFLEGRLWNRLMPGDIINLQTAIGHNGYNSYFHTVVLVSYQADGSPLFAELAGGMDNASTTRTFEQMTAFYEKDAVGNWKIDPYQTDPNSPAAPLLVTWFDPLAILNQGHLWQKSGPVVPDSSLVSAHFDTLITINIYDGTATLWEQVSGVWLPISLSGRAQFYAVTGRLLPANNTIESAFLQTRKAEIYDGDYGVYFSNHGVFQNTWTPQMLARLTGFDYISGFGGLPGSTFTALMIPQIYDPKGRLKDNWDYSSFTFHRIPDVVNQDMLLRVDLLHAANTPDSPSFGPVPVPQVYLSSGCINFDEATWAIIHDYLQGQLDTGRRVGVVFSYPNFDQSLLPTLDIFKQPFTGGVFNQWCPVKTDRCDGYDRRLYRQTYLGENGVRK